MNNCPKKHILDKVKLGPATYRIKIRILKTLVLWCAKEQARAHGFKAQKKTINNLPSGSRYGQKRDGLDWIQF